MMRQDTIHINDLSIGYRTKNDTKCGEAIYRPGFIVEN